LTAPFSEPDAGRHVDRACHVAADGRRVARALAHWCRRFELTEPEFQVLWCLADQSSGGSDQTTLARRLAYSPAQVSSTVERMRARGWIAQHSADGDRRRNLWHLSAAGRNLVAETLHAAAELQTELLKLAARVDATSPKREAA